MRAIDWMKMYKVKYDKFLNTGNSVTDAGNAILLHSEGNGKQFPPIFAVDNAVEIAAQKAAASVSANTTAGPSAPPPMPGAVPPPISAPLPEIKLFIAVSGQQYGPYDFAMCKQMVQNGQVTAQSMVWMEGMATWMPASSVPALAPLFTSVMPSIGQGMPPIPPKM